MPPKKTVTITSAVSSVMKRWKDLSSADKHREIVRYAASHGGRAVTLNLSPAFAAYLTGKEKPMREVGKRMHAELRKLDLHHLPLFLVLEATRATMRPHLHGVYINYGVPQKAIQVAMRRAVGFVPGRSGSRQFKATNIHAADGWCKYTRKDIKWTRKVLSLSGDDRLWWISHSMTRAVRDDYEAARLGHLTAANTNTPKRSAI